MIHAIGQVEAFQRCATPGCDVRVWGHVGQENHCKAHGGNHFDLPEIAEDDEWGLPTGANSGGPPPPPESRP